MEQIILDIMFAPSVNLVLAALCILTYTVNIVFLRLRREYKNICTIRTLPFYLLPCLNIIFLVYNLTLTGWHIQGYRVAKVRYNKRYKTRVTKKAA